MPGSKHGELEWQEWEWTVLPEWTVTPQVEAMYAPGANHGFLVKDGTEGRTGLDQVFHSREKGTDNPPRLVLTFG